MWFNGLRQNTGKPNFPETVHGVHDGLERWDFERNAIKNGAYFSDEDTVLPPYFPTSYFRPIEGSQLLGRHKNIGKFTTRSIIEVTALGDVGDPGDRSNLIFSVVWNERPFFVLYYEETSDKTAAAIALSRAYHGEVVDQQDLQQAWVNRRAAATEHLKGVRFGDVIIDELDAIMRSDLPKHTDPVGDFEIYSNREKQNIFPTNYEEL